MTRQSLLAIVTALCNAASVTAFVAPVFRQATAVPTTRAASSSLGMMDAASLVMDFQATTTAATIDSSNLLLSFTDQGQNLAGIFFQASLLPYLLFLYFLSFRANRIPSLGNFGFQFVLLFVMSTIPSGIISKSVYGTSLANVDWLHGGAEALLTVANVMIVSIYCIGICIRMFVFLFIFAIVIIMPIQFSSHCLLFRSNTLSCLYRSLVSSKP